MERGVQNMETNLDQNGLRFQEDNLNMESNLGVHEFMNSYDILHKILLNFM